jgi:vesicle-associated membrane protein 7
MASSSNGSSGANTTNPPLIYACIAHGTTILTSSTPAPPYRVPPTLLNHATNLVNLILPKIGHTTSSKLTYTHQDHFLSYISTPTSATIPQGLTYVVVSPASAGRKVPFAFLLSAQREFEEMYSPLEIGSMSPGGAAGEDGFDSVLAREMTKFSTAATEGGSGHYPPDNVKRVQEEIENVRGIMTENIERVLERGERIDLLVDKTGRLNIGAGEFRRRSRGLRRRMWWKNVKLMALLGFVVVFLVYLVIGMACGLPGWHYCRS